MHVICCGRGEGKTKQLIELCYKMNSEAHRNYCVIVGKDREDADRIGKMAHAMGYSSNPWPVTVDDLIRTKHSHYTHVLVDDIELLVQRLIGFNWRLAGFSITSWNDEGENPYGPVVSNKATDQ